MAIDRIELRVVSLPLVRRFVTAGGAIDRRTVLIVKVAEGQLAGWGECGAFDDPYYLPETVDSARDVIERFIAPTVLDAPLPSALDGADRVSGNRAARAAVEQAVADLAARRSGYALAEQIGGSMRAVPVGAVASIQDLPFLEQEVAGYMNAGYQRIKLKIQPGHDVKPVQMVRSTWPNAQLAVDANGSYDRSSVRALDELDDFDLEFIEQPLPPDDLSGHAHLAARLTTPLCLDESIARTSDLELTVRLAAASIVNIKPARVGGYRAVAQMGAIIQDHGLSAWVGGMLETGIGRAHAIATATLPWFDRAADLSASDRYFAPDLIDPPWTLKNGTLSPLPSPGIGVEPDAAMLESSTLSMRVLTR